MVAVNRFVRRKTAPFNFSEKHKEYIRRCEICMHNVAEGTVHVGKTADSVLAFARELETTSDRIHSAAGSAMANVKLSIGDANGLGLERIFRGQCHQGKHKDNEALLTKGPDIRGKQEIIIFVGAAKEDNYKKIRGNSYGMWITTEINLYHDNTIKEAFNRQLAAQQLKVFWDLNPDSPRTPIHTEYIDKYQRQADAGGFPDGYNYMHCTVYDDINIASEHLWEVESRYDRNGIWYLRDIKGMRVVANGFIYRRLADNTSAKQYIFRLTNKPKDIMEVILGVDFGGSGSRHSFTATAITRGYRNVITLTSEWIGCKDEKGNQIKIDPEMPGTMFCDFCQKAISRYGYIITMYADNAEQTPIARIRFSLRKHGLDWIRVENALKTEVNDRINATAILMAQGRFRYIQSECQSLVNVLSTTIWDPKGLVKDVRLNDGMGNIDSLDSLGYTFERQISRLIEYGQEVMMTKLTKMLNLIINIPNKDAGTRVDVCMTSQMANLIELWTRMYENRSPWVNNKDVSGADLALAITSEVTRLVTLELKSEVIGGPAADYLNEQYQCKVVKDLRRYVEYGCVKDGLVVKPYITKQGIGVQSV